MDSRAVGEAAAAAGEEGKVAFAGAKKAALMAAAHGVVAEVASVELVDGSSATLVDWLVAPRRRYEERRRDGTKDEEPATSER